MHIYRKIYEQHYGPIPREADGRAYEIHHKDGDKTNNRIENLLATTIQNHYEIHLEQGDYAACYRIAQRMKLSPQVISELASLENHKRVAKGTHPFLGKENNRKQVVEEIHPFLGGEIQRKTAQRRLDDGTHHNLIKYTCPFCLKEGRGPNMHRYHFDNCKQARLDEVVF